MPSLLPRTQHVAWAAPTSAGEPGNQEGAAAVLAACPERQAALPAMVTGRSWPAHHLLLHPPGDYPLPGDGGCGLGGTLAALSDLGQATLYQSAAAGLEVRAE